MEAIGFREAIASRSVPFHPFNSSKNDVPESTAASGFASGALPPKRLLRMSAIVAQRPGAVRKLELWHNQELGAGAASKRIVSATA